jgi:2-polyprenyl-6-methoxyphenol hydroxylase-like FAD-dependent oxidoreductase
VKRAWGTAVIDKTKPVIIVGFGPVGAVLTLALYQAGIKVVVAESNPTIIQDQRSVTLHPPTLEMLARLGITEQIIPLGLTSDSVRYWDRVTHNVIADISLSALAGDTKYPFVLQYEHYKLARFIYGILAGAPGVTIHLGCRVEEIAETSDGVIASLSHSDGNVVRRWSVAGSLIVGADGAQSAVRKSAGIELDGFTYPERFLKIMTPFDFAQDGLGYALRNLFLDPDEWCNLFKVAGNGPPGLWRVVFPAPADEHKDVTRSMTTVQARLKKFLPRADNYPVESISAYNVYQSVAKTFYRNKTLLVGDAAHLNNPIGGMGMNGGIHDAINLAEKLVKVWDGADEGELDLYHRQRRQIAVDFVQTQTIWNKRLLEEKDPQVRKTNIERLKRTADDPKLTRQFLRKASLIDSVEASYAIR